MTYEEQDELLRMVDELGLQRQMARVKARSSKDEWLILERIVMSELDRIREEAERLAEREELALLRSEKRQAKKATKKLVPKKGR